MEFADWIHESKRSDHSSSGTLNNGVYSSETANIIETDNDPSENSCSNMETCDRKSSEKCMDVSKLEDHLRLSTLNDSAAIHMIDSGDQVLNGNSGLLQRSSNSDDKVTVETDIPANLGPQIIGSGDGNGKFHARGTGKNEDREIKTGKDKWHGTSSDKLVSFTSDSSTDVADLEEEILARASVLQGSLHKDSMSDSNAHHMPGSSTISQQPSADRVDDGLSVAGPANTGDAAATETSMVPVVADLEEEVLARASVLQGSVHKDSMSDSVNTHHMPDCGMISQQPSADRVDDGLSVAGPADTGDAAATETSMVPVVSVYENKVDDADETLSDDSVICLDNDDSNSDSCKTKTKETDDNRKMPVYIQVVNKQPSNLKLGTISSVCPTIFPGTTVVGSNVSSSSNTLLKSGSLLPTSAIPVLNAPKTNWLLKSVGPVTDSSNQPTLLNRNRCPRAMARLLGDIGLQLVSRRVRENHVAQQKLRKSHRKKSKSDALYKLLNLEVDPVATNHLQLAMQRCSCGFMTESANVFELHYESGHESSGLQHCCLCEEYSARYSGQFVRHMESDHGRKVRVQPKPCTYLCQLCYFETNGRAIHERHLRMCQRLFVLRSNQKPVSNHCDIPIEKVEQPKPKPVNCVVDVKPKAKAVSSALSEPINSKSTLSAIKHGPPQNLVRIGSHLFIVVSKPGENVSSSSLIPTSGSHLSLLHVDKRPTPATKTTVAMTIGNGQSTGLVQLTGQSSMRSSGVTPGLLATSVLPLSSKAVISDSMWASKIAAAAVKSVISSCQPAASKILAQPSLKTSSATVSKLPSTTEPSHSISSVSNSTTFAKLLLKNQSDHVGHGSTMTCAVPSSSTPSVNIPPRNSLLLPTVRTAPATTSTPALAPPVVPKTILAKSSSVARPLAGNQPNGYVICPLCSGFIKDIQALDVHMRVAHNTGNDWAAKLFRCTKCDPVKWYSSKDALFRHQLSCHNISKSNSQGYCSRCKQTGIGDLIEHFRQKHNTTLFSMYKSRNCSFCHMQLEGHRAFESHMLLSHKNLFPSLSCLQTKIRSSGPKNSCKLCNTDDIVNLVRHMENRHQLTLNEMLRQVYCYFCSFRLQDTLSFENHMLQVHKTVFSSRDALWDEIFTSRITSGSSDATDGFCGAFKCSMCDDEFVSASYRYRHQVMSHPKRSFVCSMCRMSCGSKQSLMRHLKLRHTRLCSVPVQRLDCDTFEKHYHCTENSCSASSIDLCSSPETVVITDEDEDKVQEPLQKKPRLISDRGSRNIPPENIEEVLEIDGETVIIVQESDCC